jgi:hypothetical protein
MRLWQYNCTCLEVRNESRQEERGKKIDMLIWVEESDTDMMRRASLGANAGSHQHGAAAPTLPTFRTIESERLCISRCLPSSTDFSRRRAAANTVRINVCEFSRDWMVHLHPAQPNISVSK